MHAQEAEKKKSRQVLLQHAAIEQAAVAQPALHRMALPLQLYISVHQLQEELKEASQQPLDSQPEQMLFLTSRCADLPSKLLHKLPPAQQKKADSLAKEARPQDILVPQIFFPHICFARCCPQHHHTENWLAPYSTPNRFCKKQRHVHLLRGRIFWMTWSVLCSVGQEEPDCKPLV